MAADRRRGPQVNAGCCPDGRAHAGHLRAAIAGANAAVRRIPLAEHQDGFDHVATALFALADLRRLVDAWDADHGTRARP